MQPRPTTLALGEVPEILLDRFAVIGTIHAYNAHATDPVYLKIWPARSTAPDPAAVAAPIVYPIPAGTTTIAVFAEVVGTSYWAATDESGVGATAPAADLVVTATYEPVR